MDLVTRQARAAERIRDILAERFRDVPEADLAFAMTVIAETIEDMTFSLRHPRASTTTEQKEAA